MTEQEAKQDPTQFGEFWASLLTRTTPLLPPDATISAKTLEKLAKTVAEAPEESPEEGTWSRLHSLPPLDVVGESEEGDLQLLSILGTGGMGVVLLARQRSLQRDVAIKSLKRSQSPDAESLLREAQITGSLEHPDIIPIHALGRDGQMDPVLVMKRVEGVEWRELLGDPQHAIWAQGGWSSDPLTANLEILLEVCKAVQFAHSRNLVHRDLKPENVMLGQFGEVYLMDWGIAVEADAAEIECAGTPSYMAPEMLSGAADARTDVYLLGGILYEALTGRPPHRAPTLVHVFESVLESAPFEFDAEVPEELGAICNRATAKDPAARYPSVSAFRDAILGFLSHRSAVELSDIAAAGFAELRASLTSEGSDPATVTKQFAECRFGYLQSLREWEDNQAARAGLEACLEAMIEWELKRRRPEAASILLEELATLRPDRAEDFDAIRRRVQEQRGAYEEMQRLEHDLDASVARSLRVRLLLSAGLLAIPIALSLGTLVWRGSVSQSHHSLIGISCLFLAILLLTLRVWRRTLLKNQINRRIMYLILLGALGILGHRILAAFLGTPFWHTVAEDVFLVALVMAAASITVARWVALPALYFTCAAVFASLNPELTPFGIGSAVLLTAVTVTSFSTRGPRRRSGLDAYPRPPDRT